MKILGLIGGMSWESTAVYYKLFNEIVRDTLGGFHSCHSLIYSLDFSEIERLQHQGDRDAQLKIMLDAGIKLQEAGADIILIGTNTMHEFYDEMTQIIKVPIIHIADAVAWQMQILGLSKPALLGTRFTMEKDFYKNLLSQKYAYEVHIPTAPEKEFIHSTIYDELVQGRLLSNSRQEFIRIINNLKNRGADCAVLACTEIPMLVRQKDIAFPILDTTKIHASFSIKTLLELT